jgi:hypothetical protein
MMYSHIIADLRSDLGDFSGQTYGELPLLKAWHKIHYQIAEFMTVGDEQECVFTKMKSPDD